MEKYKGSSATVCPPSGPVLSSGVFSSSSFLMLQLLAPSLTPKLDLWLLLTGHFLHRLLRFNKSHHSLMFPSLVNGYHHSSRELFLPCITQILLLNLIRAHSSMSGALVQTLTMFNIDQWDYYIIYFLISRPALSKYPSDCM